MNETGIETATGDPVALRLNAILIRRDVYALWSTELLAVPSPQRGGLSGCAHASLSPCGLPGRRLDTNQMRQPPIRAASARWVTCVAASWATSVGPVQAVVLGAAGSQVLAVGSRVDSREAIFLLYLFQPALAGPTIPVQTEMAGSNDDRQDGEDEDAARNMVHTFSIP
jgi:hypothetical protein